MQPISARQLDELAAASLLDPKPNEEFRVVLPPCGVKAPQALIVAVQAVPADSVSWLWPEHFPIGKLSLLVGDPGRGKSLLAIDLAARLSRARPWPDADDPRRSFLIPLKCNLSPALHGMAYTAGNRPGYQAPVICWDPEPIPLALLPTSTAHPIARLEDQQATAWLYDVLKDGPVPTKDIDDAAAAEGIGKRTLRRAKAALDAQTFRSPFQSGRFSALPTSPTRKAVSDAANGRP